MTAVLSDDQLAVDDRGPLPLSMVERMTLIMQAFDRPLAKLTLDEVTHYTGLPRSTAHRILDQLVQCEWLVHARANYSLGPRSLTLGGREVAQHELRAAASGVLDHLARRTGLLVHLSSLVGSDIYFVDAFGDRRTSGAAAQVGSRRPAHRTAAGLAVMAALTPEEVDDRIAQSGRIATSPCGPVDLEGLHHELARIRCRGGVAVERGRCVPHLACVAAAITVSSGATAAISVVIRRDARIEGLLPLVSRAARSISDAIA